MSGTRLRTESRSVDDEAVRRHGRVTAGGDEGAAKGATPAGGRAGVAIRSGSGGKSRSRIGGRSLEMAWGTGAVRHAHPTTSGRYLCMLPDPVEFRREALSKFHNCFYTRQISHIR